ncbi:PLDc N-terminal domain-containing protein [Patescibacteria group bacterium]|nr:PLDc N-terminal domain-containing protein [Patescibacteria group bacterium]
MTTHITNYVKFLSLAMLATFCLCPQLAQANSGEVAAGIVALIMGLFFTGFFSLYFLFIALIIGINIGGIIIWVLMLIDCVKRDFPNKDDKTVWILVVALTSWIGALIYYFIVKRKEDQGS